MTQTPRLEDFAGPNRPCGEQTLYQYCPICGADNWKTYLNPENGTWYCFAGTHSAGGRVRGFVSSDCREFVARFLTNSGIPVMVDWAEIQLPPWMPLSKSARRYLARRGLTEDTIRKIGLVEHATDLRVLLPFFGVAGRIVYWTTRSYCSAQEGAKYISAPGRHPLFVLPSWQQYDSLVLVEGPFDAIKVWQETGRPVAALCGKVLPRYLRPELLLLARTQVDIVLDREALGDAINIRNQLIDQRAVRLRPVTEFKDPGDASGEYLRNLLLC